MSKIIAISTLSGKYKLKKEKVKLFFEQHLLDSTAFRKLNFLFNHSEIEYKNSELPDFDVELNSKLLYLDKNMVVMETNLVMVENFYLELENTKN